MSSRTNQSVSIFRWSNFWKDRGTDQFGSVRPNAQAYLKQSFGMLANNYYWSSKTIWLLNIGLCLTTHYMHAIDHHQREFHSYNWYGIYDYLGNVGIQVPWPLLQHRTCNNHGQLHQQYFLGSLSNYQLYYVTTNKLRIRVAYQWQWRSIKSFH